MTDKLSRIQSYSLNRKAGNIKFVKLKEATKKKDKIDERIAAIKRDTKITFTGRENEISQLRHIYFSQKKKLTSGKGLKNKYSQNSAQPVPAVIGIKGEAGIGKSRLISEFLKSHIKNSITGASDTHVQNPYSFFISLIKSYCVISDSDTPDKVKHKLKFSLQDLSNYEKDKPDKKNLIGSFNLLCHLLGLHSKDYRLKLPASELKIHLQLCIKNFIEAVAAKVNFFNEPLIIVCEDAHWMDDTSRNTLSYLFNTLNINKNSSGPYRIIIFLMLYRPEFKVMKDAELKADFTEIELEPLDYNSVQKILKSKNENKNVTGLLKNMTGDAVKLLTERSEGNPLFIQEWIRMFGDKYTSEELSQIKSNGLESGRQVIEIPVSINLLINKRLERLSGTELSILQYASVIGNEFTDILLKKTAKLLSDETDIERVLEKLADNRFIRKSDKTFGSDIYYEFHHDVIREVVYETIPEDNRKVMHKTAGEAIENIFHGRIEQYYYVLCEHFEKGGAEEKLIDYLEKAGDRARESFENERAIGYYERILDTSLLLYTRKYFDIFLKKFQIYKVQSDWKKAMEDYNTLNLEKSFTADKFNLLKIRLILAEVYHNKSNYPESIKILKYLKQTSKSSELYWETITLLCMNYLQMGQSKLASKYANLFYGVSLNETNNIIKAKALDLLGQVERLKGNYSKAIRHFKNSMVLFEKEKEFYEMLIIINRIGTVHYHLSEFKNAIQYFEKTLQRSIKYGSPIIQSIALGNLGNIYDDIGQNQKALNLFNQKYKIATELNNIEGIASSIASIGNLYLKDGLYDKAIINYQKALIYFIQIEKKSSISNMHSNIGLIHLYKGEYNEAIYNFECESEINESLSYNSAKLRNYLNTGNLYKKINNYDLAEKNYNKAFLLLKELGSLRLEAITNFNYAELMFDMKKYESAKKCNDKALLFSKENYVNEELFEIRLLNNKILFYSELEKKTFDLNENSLSCPTLLEAVKDLEKMLKESLKETETAKLHFELWNMKKNMKDKSESVHKEMSARLFKKLYNKTPNAEYKNFINLLSVI